MKKVTEIFESNQYWNDTDFENEENTTEENDENKSEYYACEFWHDSDFVSFNDETCSQNILVRCLDDEILVTNSVNLDIEELLERFYSDDYEKHFTALMVGNDYDFRDDKNYNSELVKLWYRGGSGYYYYCWQYNYKINKEYEEEY